MDYQEKNEFGELSIKIDRLNHLLTRQVSPWWVIFRGILAALGGTIGLAIVFTLMVYVLGKLQQIPFFWQHF